MSDNQTAKERDMGELAGQEVEQAKAMEQASDQKPDLHPDHGQGPDPAEDPKNESLDGQYHQGKDNQVQDNQVQNQGDSSSPSNNSGEGPAVEPDNGQAKAGQEMERAGADSDSATAKVAVESEKVSGQASGGDNVGSGLAVAAFAPFLLLLFLAAMFGQDLWRHWQGQGLFWPQEVAGLEALQKAMPAGQWLLQVGPSASVSNPLPGFYWFAGGLAHCLPWLEPGMISQLAASLATAILLLAVWFLAICAGLGGMSALASGIVLLCTPVFALSGNLFGPQALACALMLLSLGCFSRGWKAGTAWLALPAGFVLAGLAGLTGGLFHLLLPLVASILLLVWRGTFRRAQGADAIAGFSLMLILVIGWLALTIIRVAPENGLDHLVASQVQLVWPLASECWWISAIAALGLLPWLFLPCCVSWWDRLCNAWGSLKASRKERSGVAFIWISLCLTIACSVLASRPGSPYLTSLPLCIVCLAAPLAGSAYCGLSVLGRRFFHSLIALLLVACGLAMLALSFSISVDVAAGILPEPLLDHLRKLLSALSSLPMLGLAFLLAAIGLIFFFVIRQCHGALLYCVLACIAFYQVGSFLLMPDLAAAPNIELKSLGFHQGGQKPKDVEPAETKNTVKTDIGKAQDSQPESGAPVDPEQPDSKKADPSGSEGAMNGESGNSSSNAPASTPGVDRAEPRQEAVADPHSPKPAVSGEGAARDQAPSAPESGTDSATDSGKGSQDATENPAARDDESTVDAPAEVDKSAVGGDSAMTGGQQPETAADTAGQAGIKSGE